jgi:hypothetical protein
MPCFFHPTLATESPPESMRLFEARLPVTHSAVMNADNSTHALCLRAKSSVPQETADKLSSLVKGDIKKHQAVSRVAQVRLVEIVITGEESGPAQGMQERNNFAAIFHSRSSDLATDTLEAWTSTPGTACGLIPAYDYD